MMKISWFIIYVLQLLSHFFRRVRLKWTEASQKTLQKKGHPKVARFVNCNCYCCERRIRTSTERLATGQISFIDSWEKLMWSTHYPAFVANSPPPRQEGMSANFITSHYVFITKLIKQVRNQWRFISYYLSWMTFHPGSFWCFQIENKLLWEKDSNLHGALSHKANIFYWFKGKTYVVNPYLAFVANSPPPRQEGMSANFITSHYLFDNTAFNVW